MPDNLSFGKEHIQVVSLKGNINVKFSLDQRDAILHFLRLLNGNELREIRDGTFQNLKKLEYMYVSYLAHFCLVFVSIITHGSHATNLQTLGVPSLCCHQYYNMGEREAHSNFPTRCIKMNSS